MVSIQFPFPSMRAFCGHKKPSGQFYNGMIALQHLVNDKTREKDTQTGCKGG
jgi:hypothetical protein